jgi:hypothetical protein
LSDPGFAATSFNVTELRLDIFREIIDTVESPRLVPALFCQTTILSGVVEFGTKNAQPVSIFMIVFDILSYNSAEPK